MSRARLFAVLAGFAAVIAVALLTPAGQLASQTLREVFVVNFPDVQTVQGEVSLRDPVPQARLVAIHDVTVPPVPRTETTRLIDAGLLTTDGYPAVVLSLHGEVKGSVTKVGDVGVILIPDQDSVRRAFDEQGLLHFTLETAAPAVSSRTPFFASDQPRFRLGFDRYRVLLYNTTDKTVTVNVYAYLTQ